MSRHAELCRWVHRIDAPALVVVRAVVRAANSRALRLCAAVRAEIEGRPLHTLLQEGSGRGGAARSRRPRVWPGAGSRWQARVCTAGGRRVPVDVHTLIGGSCGELLVLIERGALMQRHSELLRRHAALLARVAEELTDDERHRRHIAGLVHDRVQQALAVVQMELQAASARSEDARRDDDAPLYRALRGVAGTLQATREVVEELRLPLLSDLGLLAALEHLADRLETTGALRVERDWVDGEPLVGTLDHWRAAVLYRAAEQGLHAIGSETPAASVRIAVRAAGEHGVVLAVDGPRAGLRRAAERFARLGDWARALGGDLAVAEAAPGSARLAVRVPLAAPPAPARIDEQSDAPLLGLFHRLPVGVIETDVDGRVEMMNRAAARMLWPVVRPHPMDNLFEALGFARPGLRQQLESSGGAALRVVVPPQAGPAIGLTFHRQDGARWLVVVQ